MTHHEQGIHVTALTELHESPTNPREISDERFDSLKYALARDPDMLMARPIIATPDGEVVCGNMRLRALVDLGWTEAPVFFQELDDKRKREWMLRDNQEYGDWVPEELAAMVALHKDEEADLKLLGFTEGATANLIKLAEQASSGGSEVEQDGVAPEVWGVIVDVDGEDSQAKLIEELTERGYRVRALVG